MGNPGDVDLSATQAAANLAAAVARCQGRFTYFQLAGDPRVAVTTLGFLPMSGAKVYALPEAQQRVVRPGPTGGTTVGWNAVYRGTPMALYAACDPAYVALGKALVLWEALNQFDLLDRRTPLIEGSLMPPAR